MGRLLRLKNIKLREDTIMLSGPIPPKWFARDLNGAYRVREFEIFLRELCFAKYEDRYLSMEIESNQHYRGNCKRTATSLLHRIRMRLTPSRFLTAAHYRPTNSADLEILCSYILQRGLMTGKAEVTLDIWNHRIR